MWASDLLTAYTLFVYENKTHTTDNQASGSGALMDRVLGICFCYIYPSRISGNLEDRGAYILFSDSDSGTHYIATVTIINLFFSPAHENAILCLQ